MINVNTTIQEGGLLDYHDRNDFLRVMDAEAPLTITYYRNGAEVARAENVGEGYAEKFDGGAYFDRVTIYSATAQTVQIAARFGNVVAYDKAPTGQVQLTGEQGSFGQAQKTVTNASTTILAAKANRRYLLIQNNDPSGIIYIRLDGFVSTSAVGIKIEPGGSYECAGFAPSGSITAIGSIASNANVVAVEG